MIVDSQLLPGVAHCLDHLLSSRHHAEGGEGAAIDHGLAVDEYLVLGIAAVNHIDINAQFASDPRRHTGGMNA